MTKSQSKTGIGQMNLFDLLREVETQQQTNPPPPTQAGSYNIDAQLREAISAALKTASVSRYGVAAAMSELLGVEISKSQLDSWSAESKTLHRFPLAYASAFVQATGDATLLRIICRKVGGFYIQNADALRLELGRMTEQKAEIAKRERLLRGMLQRFGERMNSQRVEGT